MSNKCETKEVTGKLYGTIKPHIVDGEEVMVFWEGKFIGHENPVTCDTVEELEEALGVEILNKD